MMKIRRGLAAAMSLAVLATGGAVLAGATMGTPAAYAADSCSSSQDMYLGPGAEGTITVQTDQSQAQSATLARIKQARQAALDDPVVKIDFLGGKYTVRELIARLAEPDVGFVVTEQQYLNPQWSYAMERLAMQRAAEAHAVDGMPHTRPDGTDIFATDAKGNYSLSYPLGAAEPYSSFAEVYAWQQPASSFTASMDAWLDERQYMPGPVPPGKTTVHYENLVNPAFGAWGFGKTQKFVAGEGLWGPSESTATTGWSGACEFKIRMRTDQVDWTVDPIMAGTTATMAPTAFAGRVTVVGTLTSSDPSVATVNGMTVTALKAGTTTLTLATGDKTITRTLTVNPGVPVIQSVANPAPVTTASGQAPVLPATVVATWTDGHTTNEPVVWNSYDPSLYQARQGGTFVVTGTAAGKPVSVKVNVTPATPQPVVISDNTTPAGTIPNVPATVQVTWSNGDVTREPVTWPVLRRTEFTRVGSSYGIQGDIPGFPGTVRYMGTVVPATPLSAAPVDVETTPDVAPTLPATVDVTYSDDTVVARPVVWDPVAASQYAKPGTFDVMGTTVNGLKAVSHVTVVGVRPISADAPAGVTTDSGTYPSLPATTTVKWSDGSTSVEPITWDAIPADYYSTRIASEFTATGKAAGVVVEVVVKVNAARMVSAADPKPVTTLVGQEPALPTTVQVTWSNGDVTDEPVTFEAITEDQYAQPGTFSVAGTVDGTPLTVTQVVEVEAAVISSVESPTVHTIATHAPVLPDTVKVTWSNGQRTNETVMWESVDLALYATPGSFDVKGVIPATTTARMAAATRLPDGTAVVAHVVVDARVATSAAAISPVSTASGTKPTLPATVAVTWNDGATTTETITWDAVLASQYGARQGGTFTVSGTVAGLRVSTQLTVAPATMVSAADPTPITTPAGVVPTLPATVEVTWSNSDKTMEKVFWQPSDPAVYNKPTEFDVPGYVVGSTPTQYVDQHVKIVDAAIASVDEPAPVKVESGTKPVLPQTVEAHFTDGTTADVAVTWDAVPDEVWQSKAGGTFVISGQVAGFARPVKVTLEVAPAPKDPEPTPEPTTDPTPTTEPTAPTSGEEKGDMSPALPKTGGESAPLAGAVAVTLVVGGVAAASRKRR